MHYDDARVLGSMGRCLGLMLTMLLLLIAGAPSASAQLIKEYAIPTANSQPHHIALGPDGNLWFTETNTDKLAKITTAGAITECPALTAGSQPVGIVTGPDSNLWFNEFAAGANKLVQMDTSCNILNSYPVPTAGAGPAYMIVGPDNNLWFVEQNVGNIATFVLSSKTFNTYSTTSASSDPEFIVAGPDGNMWFTEFTAGKIGKITTAGLITEYPTPSSTNPRTITVGPDNNLWFTLDGPNGNSIGKIVIASLPAMAIFQNPTSGSPSPFFIIPGPDGGLWFTEFSGNAIGRITTAGVFTGYYPVPTSASEPRAMALGPQGAIWFTEQTGNNIGKLLPSIVITAAHDFNGDNKSDILWRDTSGDIAAWLMTGATVSQSAALGSVPGAFSIVGQKHFNGAPGGASAQSGRRLA